MCAVNIQLDDFFSSYMPSLSTSLRENRLERMRMLLERIGNPEKKLKTIHVAGSKGKGTVATALSFMLSSLGLKTGLYLSPHVYDIRERFTNASAFFSDEEYLSALEKLKNLISGFTLMPSLGTPLPTTYELYTAYSYLLFQETGCEWAVIETGMGGRLDATNTLSSEASVITKIELEHTSILGDTLEKIAGEKAGIIKRERNVFVLDQDEVVLDVFRKRAEALSSPIHVFRKPEVIIKNGRTDYLESTIVFPSDANDITVTDILYASFILSTMKTKTQKRVFDFTSPLFHLPGRNERRSALGCKFLLDGAHTPVSVSFLIDTVKEDKSKAKTLIFSSAEDKDHKRMLSLLIPLFEKIIITGTGKWKKSDPERIFTDAVKMFPQKRIMLIPDHVEVVKTAVRETEKDSLVVATGSFYLLAELDRAIKECEYGD